MPRSGAWWRQVRVGLVGLAGLGLAAAFLIRAAEPRDECEVIRTVWMAYAQSDGYPDLAAFLASDIAVETLSGGLGGALRVTYANPAASRLFGKDLATSVSVAYGIWAEDPAFAKINIPGAELEGSARLGQCGKALLAG